jgi:hypothetical protein
MQIVIRPAAAADIEDAFVWYDQQRSGLGSEFLKAVDDALIAIQRAPQLHSVIHRKCPKSSTSALSVRRLLPNLSRSNRGCRVHAWETQSQAQVRGLASAPRALSPKPFEAL